MSSQLQVTKTLIPADGTWRVSAVVIDGGTLPLAIFLYSVTSTGELGEYMGVTDRSQLTSRAAWAGSPVPTFGNSYVRHVSMVDDFSTEADADEAIAYLVKHVTLLSQELQSTAVSVTVYPIP